MFCILKNYIFFTLTFVSLCANTNEFVQNAQSQELYTDLETYFSTVCYSSFFARHNKRALHNALYRNLPIKTNLQPLNYTNPLPAYDGAVLISMVKDEEDIIFANLCWHHFMGFRKFIIIDNGSTDNTSALIDSFKELTASSAIVIKIDDSRVLYAQISRINACIKLAEMTFPEIKWIFPNDADEFITLDEPLEQTLSKVPCETNCLYTPRITYVPTDDYFMYSKNTPFYESLHIAHKRNPYGFPDNFPYLGKTFIKAHQGLLVVKGNHLASIASATQQNYLSGLNFGVHIREFPLRSPEHALKKIINMGRAFEKLNEAHPNSGGKNNGRHYSHERYERYLEVGDAIGMEEFKNFMTMGGVSFDERMPLELAIQSVTTPEPPTPYSVANEPNEVE